MLASLCPLAVVLPYASTACVKHALFCVCFKTHMLASLCPLAVHTIGFCRWLQVLAGYPSPKMPQVLAHNGEASLAGKLPLR